MANNAATHIDLFDRTIQETHGWLGDVMSESGLRDRHYALQALRSVLHALRDELSVEQNAALSAQLPTMIRGLYFEGWVPNRTGDHTTRESFVRKIDRAFMGYAEPFDVGRIITGVLAVLERRLTDECRKIRATLPKDLRELWP